MPAWTRQATARGSGRAGDPNGMNARCDLAAAGGAGAALWLRAGSLCTRYRGLGLPVLAVLDAALAWCAETDRHASAVASGSLLTQDVEVQAVACLQGCDQCLQLPGRGRLGPCRPPALQRDPGGKPGAHRP